jgi:general secretion pathway protein D
VVSSGHPYPVISSQELKTSVTVPNQGTLVLGGLIKVTKNKTVSGIPYLSRIPVLGNLFKSTGTTKDRSELVIIIRPEVSVTPREDVKTREREMEFLHLEPDLESTMYPINIRQTDKEKSPQIPLRSSPVTLKQQEDFSVSPK